MLIFRRLAVFLCLFATCFAQHTPRKCADVPILMGDGKPIRLSKFRGKVVMIEMMLTECPECLQTLQFMGRLQNELGPRGFQAIGIALDENPTNAKALADRYRFPFPVGRLDKDGAIKLADLNATAHPVVPYLIFVDWEGNVRFQYAGNDPVFNSGEKNIRAVADGLVRQAIEKKGPQYETKPAGK
jgi:thiol-disulfide isomerase/thioredoxin